MSGRVAVMRNMRLVWKVVFLSVGTERVCVAPFVTGVGAGEPLRDCLCELFFNYLIASIFETFEVNAQEPFQFTTIVHLEVAV